MKKFTSIFLLTAAAIMLSSCVIVGTDDLPNIVVEEKPTTVVTPATQTPPPAPKPTPVYKYSITCKNETSITVTDWCVKKDNIVTYAKSDRNCAIRPGGEDMISNLEEGYYRVYFTFEDTYQLQPGDYFSSENIYLNRDVTYCLYERPAVITYKSAGGTESKGIQLYLAGSDGTEIELVKE